MSFAKPPYRHYWRNKLADRLMRTLVVLATLVAIIPLVLIIGYVLVIGGSALNRPFFTQTYQPPLAIGSGLGSFPDNPVTSAPTLAAVADASTTSAATNIAANDAPTASAAPAAASTTADPFANLDVNTLVNGGAATAGATQATAVAAVGAASPPSGGVVSASSVVARGGVLHGIVGTLLVTGLALLMALPIGLLAGIFLAEFRNNPIATLVRFCTDVLSGAPSIIAGVVAYILVVQRLRSNSGLAGSLALALLMVPTITRTTEEILKLVPTGVREAAQALGASRWYATFTVVVPTALAGIMTGVLLAFARGAGETAPLLLTIGFNPDLAYNLLEPIAALPRLTYEYSNSPYPSENKLAWGAAFVLMMTVLVVNILVRLATRRRWKGR